MKRLFSALSALTAALALSACGWAEWPADSQVYSVNTPQQRPPHTSPAPAPQSRTAALPPTTVPQVRQQDVPPPGRGTVDGAAGTVTVGRGDTVYALSRRYNVSPRAIIDANDLRPPYRLEVGQHLVLPSERVHRVASGETLYGISRIYDIDMYTLAQANDLERPYTIRSGQELRIPAGTPEVRQVDSARGQTRVASTLVSRPAAKPQPPRAAVTEPPKRKGGFIWPAKGRIISRFGPKSKGLHNDGINIAAPRGTEVRAAENGIVAYAGNEIRGFGNLLLIKHDGGWITAYAHNDQLLVKRGDTINRGQVIARVGSTGNVTSPQLHFEIRRGRSAVDPMVHLSSAKSS